MNHIYTKNARLTDRRISLNLQPTLRLRLHSPLRLTINNNNNNSGNENIPQYSNITRKSLYVDNN